ncbi:MAG: flagellar basal body P-ring formation protein FlgA [Deltaproteobacteria bacterium]|nr:flagellar basal body P-ring formation protein FlgA [Deltaproteobacteria bacterium]
MIRVSSFLVFILIGMMDCHAASAVTSISLFEGVEINNSEILLKDIAEIKGGDPSLTEKIQDIAIGRSPLPGKSRRIDRSFINLRLKQNSIDLNQVRLEGEDQVEVLRGFIEVSRTRINDIVLEYIYKNNPWEKNRLTVKSVDVKNSVILPKGKTSCRVIVPKGKNFLGTLPLTLVFEVNGEQQRSIYITADLEVLTEVVIASRPLKRRTVITEDDVRIQEMDLAVLSANTVLKSEDVLGKRTKREISPNMVFRTDLIEVPPVIKKGDTVMIIAESDSIKISMIGAARDEGCIGERIRVENIDSKKFIYAEILDPKTVKVEF